MSTTAGTLHMTYSGHDQNGSQLTRTDQLTADKLYKSLSANIITAKLTNHFQRTRLTLHRLTYTIHLTLKMTSAQFVEKSVINNSSFQNYHHPEDELLIHLTHLLVY